MEPDRGERAFRTESIAHGTAYAKAQRHKRTQHGCPYGEGLWVQGNVVGKREEMREKDGEGEGKRKLFH